MGLGCVVLRGVPRSFGREKERWEREESQNGEKIYSSNWFLVKQAFRFSMYQAHLSGLSRVKSRPAVTTAYHQVLTVPCFA